MRDAPTDEVNEGPVLSPLAAHDLRDGAVTALIYSRQSVVVVAGIPGAGKSTLIHRLYGTTGSETQRAITSQGVSVMDSEQSRNRCRKWLHRLPYGAWRPLVHLLHFARLRSALRTSAPIVLQDCATRTLVPRLLRRWCTRRSLELHLVLLEVDPDVALAGQRARGRLVRSRSFDLNCRRWMQRTARGPLRLIRGACSAVILDRDSADRLQAIRFR